MASRFGFKALKYTIATGGLVVATAPVALAQESKKPSIYDDDEKSESIVSYPGQSAPAHEHVEDKKSNQESKTGLKNEIVNGVRVRTSETLENNMNVARKWLIEQKNCATKQIDRAFQKYLHAEQSVTSTVAELKSEKEDILPSGIYVLISTLTGSIVSRNRNFLVRGLAPVVFGVGAFAYFLPQTFNNTRALVWKYEQKSPALAEYHLKTQKQIEELSKDLNNAADYADKSLESGVKKTRELISESTGLQLGDNSSKKK